MFNAKDVAEYYNTTQNHYERWWNLKQTHSLHYGIWDERTKTFGEALMNTNRILMELAAIKSSDRVLDAGCGVGGAAVFIHLNTHADVTGITLSEKQVNTAKQFAREKGADSNVDFQVMDYTKTEFKDESFDVIWGCESISSAPDKRLFLKEAFRLLKPSGRLVMSDYFLTQTANEKNQSIIDEWTKTWAISGLNTTLEFEDWLEENQFKNIQIRDYTQQIMKSAKRMYYASILGAIPSELYNITHPKVSRFAKSHYKSGYYQYRALQENLWKYNVILAQKK